MNVETSYEEIQKDLESNLKKKVDDGSTPKTKSIPEEDITAFCLWLKNELGYGIGKVAISKRLKGAVPAVIFGKVSASMRMMMQMMDQ